MSDSISHSASETRGSNSIGQPIHVGVVVLNWQQFEATKACVQSVLQLAGRGKSFILEVVICDNASRDGSPALLQSWINEQADDCLHFLDTGRNGGYAFGNNRGIEYLLQIACPDYIWILNNDTQLESHSLRHLLASSESHPEVMIWGSTLVNSQERDFIECAGGYHYCPMTGRVRGHLAGAAIESLGIDDKTNDLMKAAKFDYVSGASMFCKSKVFNSYGLMSEDYFLYYEEYDLVKRMGDKAAHAWCPNSIVYHVGGLSTGEGRSGHRSPTQQYYDVFNTFKFTCRYYKPFFISVLLVRILTQPIALLLRGELRLVGAFFRALADFFIWAGARVYAYFRSASD